MLTSIALSSLIFFHHGDHVPAYEFSHYPCAIKPLYIQGLDETNTYLYANGLFLHEDRIIYHLNPRVTRFEIRNNDDNSVVGEIHLRWKTDCEHSASITTSTTNTNENEPSKSLPTNLTTTTSVKKANQTKKQTDFHETTRVKPNVDHINHNTAKQNTFTDLRKLQLWGIDKQTLYLDEPFNLLQNVYLRDNLGNDLSHRLTHSPFTNDREGTFFVEITGEVDDLIVRSLMEVEVIKRKASPSKLTRDPSSNLFIITSIILGGFSALWYYIRK